ncbi:hypothetical protein L9F63_020239, partial [Diploptera punctata]
LPTEGARDGSSRRHKNGCENTEDGTEEGAKDGSSRRQNNGRDNTEDGTETMFQKIRFCDYQ